LREGSSTSSAEFTRLWRDRAGKETRRWTLHGAWIKVLEYDDLEGGNTENSMEKIAIRCQYRSSRTTTC